MEYTRTHRGAVNGIEYTTPSFGSHEVEKKLDHKAALAKEKESQTAPCVVCLGCTVETIVGTRHEGEPIEAAQVNGASTLAALKGREVVSVLSPAELEMIAYYADAKYMVNPNSTSVGTHRGHVRTPGQPFKQEDLALDATPEQQRADRLTGMIETVAAKPSDDGKASFDYLISRGYLVPIPKQPKRAAR